MEDDIMMRDVEECKISKKKEFGTHGRGNVQIEMNEQYITYITWNVVRFMRKFCKIIKYGSATLLKSEEAKNDGKMALVDKILNERQRNILQKDEQVKI